MRARFVRVAGRAERRSRAHAVFAARDPKVPAAG